MYSADLAPFSLTSPSLCFPGTPTESVSALSVDADSEPLVEQSLDDGANTAGVPHAQLSGVPSISGWDVPASPRIDVDDHTLFVQQDVLVRVGGVLDNPVLTPAEQKQRLDDLRGQSELGVLMFRVVYRKALESRHGRAINVARASLANWGSDSVLATSKKSEM